MNPTPAAHPTRATTRTLADGLEVHEQIGDGLIAVGGLLGEHPQDDDCHTGDAIGIPRPADRGVFHDGRHRGRVRGPEEGMHPGHHLVVIVPREKMSERASRSPPTTCSGDM